MSRKNWNNNVFLILGVDTPLHATSRGGWKNRNESRVQFAGATSEGANSCKATLLGMINPQIPERGQLSNALAGGLCAH
jgi:hypothetical protein